MTINIEREFVESDAYFYNQLLFSKGYARIDSKDDASYYGNWASVQDRVIFSYAESDCTTTTCDTADEFESELRKLSKWLQERETWIGIDVGTNPNAVNAWNEAGFADLIDGEY